jgi:hypothetical protein
VLELKVIKLFFVIIILLSINFVNPQSLINYDNSKDSCKPIILSDSERTINDNIEEHDNELPYGSRNIGKQIPRSTLIEKNNHGGSWVDSFKDDSGIDWKFSSNLELFEQRARIKFSDNLDNHTVAFWHLDKGTGTTVYDATTNNNDGTIYGTKWVNGKFGKAIEFNGIDDYIQFSDNDDFSINTTGNLTVEFLLKTDDDISFLQEIICKGNQKSLEPWEWTIRLDNKHIEAYIKSSLGRTIRKERIGVTLSKFTWYHVVVIFTGFTQDDEIIMYLDGVKKNILKTKANYNYTNTDSELGMGYSHTTGTWECLDGTLDEVRISNIARPPLPEFANITSKPIFLPAGMQWNSLVIDRTLDPNTLINVSILNATNNKVIPGSLTYTDGGEFDISYIDSSKYPSIRLYGLFKGIPHGLTPKLSYWGVSWNASKVWRDTLFGGLKIIDPYNGWISDGNITFHTTGEITSIPIKISENCYYDILRFTKSVTGSYPLKVSVLHEYINSAIPGYQDLTSPQVDISDIDPNKYPGIRLKATFSDAGETGRLYDWSVTWKQNNPPKILDIISKSTVNRTYALKIFSNLTDQEDTESRLTLKIQYKFPNGTGWFSDYINELKFENDRWECLFLPPAEASIGTYEFRFVCNDSLQGFNIYQNPYFIRVLNNKPVIRSIQTNTTKFEVYRSRSLKLLINVTDIDNTLDNLTIHIKYKSPTDSTWNTNYLNDQLFNNNIWEANFSPTSTAKCGKYIFNISCNDSISEIYRKFKIIVLNNKPTKPMVKILPTNPKTIDDLIVKVSDSKDIETKNLKFWYYWYKDGSHIDIFDNLTVIPSDATIKGELWSCVVYPYDGDDKGEPGKAEVEIQNSAPITIEQDRSFKILEDSTLILEKFLLNIFDDPDNEPLMFSAVGQNKINVEIFNDNGTVNFTPANNWFGSEIINFYAVDLSFNLTECQVTMIVEPTNDLPKFLKVGTVKIDEQSSEVEIIINQNEKVSLPILVEDIDGDHIRNMISFSFNITWQDNLYFKSSNNELIFNPTNSDVGWKFIQISICDNNETPLVHVHQKIKIKILNANDPPSVRITEPVNDAVFLITDNISFCCVVEDIDLLLPSYNETHIISWNTNKSGGTFLGTGKILVNPELIPGYHNITVEVKDTGGEIVFDFIHILVKDLEKSDTKSSTKGTTGDLLLWIIFMVILIIILSIISFVIIKNKKLKDKTLSSLKTKRLTPSKGPRTLKDKTNLKPEPLSAEQEKVLKVTEDVCMDCGQQLYFNAEKNQNYCFHCKKYD